MKKMLKKSDVLREGYVKGLKEAQRIISGMLKESDDFNLPVNTDIEVDEDRLKGCNDDEEVNDLVMDTLSDKYGFCHYGCETITHVGGNVFHCEGIDWDTSD